MQGQDKSNDDTNGNDGNRNFDTGLVSRYSRSPGPGANYQNYGLFVRGTAFYDTQIAGQAQATTTGYQPSQSYPNNPYFTGRRPVESAGTNARFDARLR